MGEQLKGSELEFFVPIDQDGVRIDRVVAQGAGVSRRVARTWVATGRVRVGKKVVRILSRTLKAGQPVSVQADVQMPAANGPATVAVDDIEILHLDADVIVVNKPSGLLSEPDRLASPSVLSMVPGLLRRKGEASADLWLVHRLDAGTSGVMVLARRAAATRHLGDAFRQGTVNKRYLALCSGEVRGTLSINEPIGKDKGSKHRVMDGGKAALTTVKPLVSTPGCSLVACVPQTGRTHQIRVHLAHVGHPILGDRLYGGPSYTKNIASQEPLVNSPIARVMLHAHRLAFPHPRSQTPVRFEAPVPEDFAALVQVLGLEVT